MPSHSAYCEKIKALMFNNLQKKHLVCLLESTFTAQMSPEGGTDMWPEEEENCGKTLMGKNLICI